MKPFNFITTKNILALVIITCADAMPCKSQKVTVGLLAGINSTFLWNSNINGTLSNESTMTNNFTTGASYGIDGHLSLSKHFDVSLGLIRSNQNQSYSSSYDIGFNYSSTELNTRFDYLDIPVLIRLKAKWFYLEAGPQVGFLLNAEEDFFGNGFVDVTDSFKPVNLILDFGTGFSCKIHGRFSMTGGLRMGLGISDVTREYDNIEDIPLDASMITRLAHTTIEDYYWVDILLGQTNGANTYESYDYKKTIRNFIGLNLTVRYNLFAN